MNRAAQMYRQRAVETATPVGRVVLLYGSAIASVNRAIRAVESGDIAKRVSEINHVLAILAELQGTLDFERGGEVARSLEQFYSVMRSRALEGSVHASTTVLKDLAAQLSQMCNAWQVVERETAAGVSSQTGDRARFEERP